LIVIPKKFNNYFQNRIHLYTQKSNIYYFIKLIFNILYRINITNIMQIKRKELKNFQKNVIFILKKIMSNCKPYFLQIIVDKWSNYVAYLLNLFNYDKLYENKERYSWKILKCIE